ncbi:PrgI family protein [Saccharopolyspora shandongensis]
MTEPIRIPSDVDREDRLLANLTARQLAILAVTGVALYLGWLATRTVVALPVFVAMALPIAALVLTLVLGQRDGISLDRLAVAALRQRMAPARRVTAPEGVQPAPDWLTVRAHHTSGPDLDASRLGAVELPATGVGPASVAKTGVVDLGTDGLAVVAVASAVNFALRTPTEQSGLVAGFGRYLHSLTAPIQILVRAERLDLTTRSTSFGPQQEPRRIPPSARWPGPWSRRCRSISTRSRGETATLRHRSTRRGHARRPPDRSRGARGTGVRPRSSATEIDQRSTSRTLNHGSEAHLLPNPCSKACAVPSTSWPG